MLKILGFFFSYSVKKKKIRPSFIRNFAFPPQLLIYRHFTTRLSGSISVPYWYIEMQQVHNDISGKISNYFPLYPWLPHLDSQSRASWHVNGFFLCQHMEWRELLSTFPCDTRSPHRTHLDLLLLLIDT